jgi:hypothetical protein
MLQLACTVPEFHLLRDKLLLNECKAQTISQNKAATADEQEVSLFSKI